MRAAHRRKAVVLAQKPGEPWVDRSFVVAFVHDHLLLNDTVGFGDQRRAAMRRLVIERIGDRPQPVEMDDQRLVIAAQFVPVRLRHAPPAVVKGRRECTQCVENDSDIDHFLREAGGYRWTMIIQPSTPSPMQVSGTCPAADGRSVPQMEDATATLVANSALPGPPGYTHVTDPKHFFSCSTRIAESIAPGYSSDP